ncbi:MAG: iron-containing alcohol dehydrogenase [Acidobacteriota bacterium]|nr:iron-containing alcohol dehydrogenase [Acidobacteriota bacterium]
MPSKLLEAPADATAWDAELGGLRLLYGAGRLAELGDVAAGYGRRPLVVTDPGLRRAGHAERALDSLAAAGLTPEIFDRVEENPTTDTVGEGLEVARRHRCDLLVAVGGGSPMDCAKGINFLLTNGGSMEDYRGWAKTTQPMLPALAVPTTAGTGSDAQSYALISRVTDHAKLACGDPQARFAAVLLDPELLASAPRSVLAHAGIDALSHAVESYVCTLRNPISKLYAREAFRRLLPALPRLVADPTDAEAAPAMLLGAHLAGAAIEQSMLGIAHSCANPLTAHYGVIHGVAVGLMLPSVVRFNAEAAETGYRELLSAAGEAPAGERSAESIAGRESSEVLAWRIERLLRQLGLPANLAAAGVEERALPALAREAAGQWTASFNPRPVKAEDLEALYREVWSR